MKRVVFQDRTMWDMVGKYRSQVYFEGAVGDKVRDKMLAVLVEGAGNFLWKAVRRL